VLHTAGEPPSLGSTILATIGSTKNISPALMNSVAAKAGTTVRDDSSRSWTSVFKPTSDHYEIRAYT
jgi:hypothetical protein